MCPVKQLIKLVKPSPERVFFFFGLRHGSVAPLPLYTLTQVQAKYLFVCTTQICSRCKFDRAGFGLNLGALAYIKLGLPFLASHMVSMNPSFSILFF